MPISTVGRVYVGPLPQVVTGVRDAGRAGAGSATANADEPEAMPLSHREPRIEPGLERHSFHAGGCGAHAPVRGERHGAAVGHHLRRVEAHVRFRRAELVPPPGSNRGVVSAPRIH